MGNYLETFVRRYGVQTSDYRDSGNDFPPTGPPQNENPGGMIGPNVDPDGDGDVDLTARQQWLANATISCVSQFGQFTMDDGPEGCDYQKENWNLARGLACKNCIFYLGAGDCSVVTGNIDPLGVCKFNLQADPKLADDDAPGDTDKTYDNTGGY